MAPIRTAAKPKVATGGGCFLLAVVCAGLFGLVRLTAGAGNTERIILQNADTLRSRSGIRELIGHVRIKRGETIITSDRALYDPAAGKVILTGSVTLWEPARTIEARRVSYDEQSGDFEASGEVDMTIGDSLRIRCKLARYTELDRTVDLYDEVIIDNLSDNARITGRHGYWTREDEVGVIDQDPIYRLPDTEGDPPDTLTIVSKRLTFYRNSRSALFTGRVRLTRGDLKATADTLHHQPDSSLTVLSGGPVIYQRSDELSGRRIRIYYQGREVDRIFVNGDAVVDAQAKPGDSRRDHLVGERLIITTIDDSTRRVRVEGDARGLYHVWDEDDRYSGVNLSAADVIELLIVADQTESIALEGHTSGTFYPPGMEPEGIENEPGHIPGARMWGGL